MSGLSQEADQSKKGYVTFNDLKIYVSTAVMKWTDRNKCQRQNPGFNAFGEGDIPLAYYKKHGIQPVEHKFSFTEYASVSSRSLETVISTKKEWVRAYILPPEKRLKSITSIVISPNGKTLLSGSHDHKIRVWKLDTGELLHELSLPKKWPPQTVPSDFTVAVSSDGQIVAGGNRQSNYIKLWDLNNLSQGEPIKTINKFIKEGVDAIFFIPSSKNIVIADSGGVISVVNWHREELLFEFKDKPSYLALSHDGVTLASGSGDRAIKLWNIQTGELLRPLVKTSAIKSLNFSSDGNLLISGHADNKIRLWDIKTSNPSRIFEGHSKEVRAVAISPDNRILASGSEDTKIMLWDISSGKRFKTFSEHSEGVNSIVFSSDGKYFASSGKDGKICVWKAQSS